jgi:hypothetical protein
MSIVPWICHVYITGNKNIKENIINKILEFVPLALYAARAKHNPAIAERGQKRNPVIAT